MIRSNGIKVCCFDWSGTVSYDQLPVYEANKKLSELYGISPLSFEEWLSTTKQSVIDYMRHRGVDEKPEVIFSMYENSLNEVIDAGTVPVRYNGVEGVFEYLRKKDIKTAVLSSHPEKNLLKEIERYGLCGNFDLVIGSVKDKANELGKMCRSFKESPERVLYIGDMAYDIRSAKQAGVRSAGVCWGYHDRDTLAAEHPDFLFETLSELMNVL